MAQTQTRHVIVEANVRGDKDIVQMAKSMAGMNKATKELNQSLKGFGSAFKNIFVTSIIATGIRNVVGLADRMQMLGARIRVFNKDGTPSIDIINKLATSANSARVSLEGISEIYSRMAIATNNTGLATSDLISLTETLQKTFAISGSSAQEATAASIQFSQAIASNRLSGDEFRSVMEQNAYLAQILAKNLAGGDLGKLRAMANNQELINKKVLPALAEAAKEVDERMKAMEITVGQAVTITQTKFARFVANLNSDIGITTKMGKAILALSDNLEYLGVIAGLLALRTLPMLWASLKAGAVALKGLAIANPITAILLGLSLAGVAIYKNWDRVKDTFLAAYEVVVKLGDAIRKMTNASTDWLAELAGGKKGGNTGRAAEAEAEAAARVQKKLEDIASKRKTLQDKIAKENGETEKDYAEMMKRIRSSLTANTGGKEYKSSKEIWAELNAEFRKHGDVVRYFDAMDTTKMKVLNFEFDKGRRTLKDLLEAESAMAKAETERQMNRGRITPLEYQTRLDAIAMKDLKLQLDTGAISLQKYREETQLLRTNTVSTYDSISLGLKKYLDGIKTYSESVTEMTGTVLKATEDEFVDLFTKGSATWEKFGETVINEIARITYRLLVLKPLLESITTMMGGPMTVPSVGGGGANASYLQPTAMAKGGAIGKNGIEPFATGGVFNSPTMFGFGNNRLGVLGEAGPEAIMPLRRTAGGSLGVQATASPVVINVINESGANVETSESMDTDGNRMINMRITAGVKESIENGSLDGVMRRNYGLSRKGAY